MIEADDTTSICHIVRGLLLLPILLFKYSNICMLKCCIHICHAIVAANQVYCNGKVYVLANYSKILTCDVCLPASQDDSD